MAYTEKARQLRRCKQTTKAGAPCRQYALWGRDVCVAHSERQHRGPMPDEYTPTPRAQYVPCSCAAYAWPHRPGGGYCRWPDPPWRTSSTPAGSRRYSIRLRPRWHRKQPRGAR